jgi:hypothetical protein
MRPSTQTSVVNELYLASSGRLSPTGVEFLLAAIRLPVSSWTWPHSHADGNRIRADDIIVDEVQQSTQALTTPGAQDAAGDGAQTVKYLWNGKEIRIIDTQPRK